LEFSLVFEAVSERRVLTEIAPHLVTPLGFLFPVYKSSRRSVWVVNLGMWVYDGLSLFRSPKIHKNLSARQIADVEPALSQEGLKGAPLYWDCATDDARLTLETALDAASQGAVVLTWTKAVELLRNPEGRIRGALLQDLQSGERFEVEANVVINATGPWSDATRALSGEAEKMRLRPTKGVHIVVPAERLKVDNAVVCFHPNDGRVLFAIPWGDQTYIGTTDTDFSGDPGKVAADAEDVRYLLAASNFYFPAANLQREDVQSTWAGVRPLIGQDEAANESKVSREHDIRVDPDMLITIAGGKLTTYRRMGAEVVEKAVSLLLLQGRLPTDLRPARTDREPLPGAVGWPEDDDFEKVVAMVRAAGGELLSERTCRMLARSYGTRGADVARRAAQDQRLLAPITADRPEILAQVDHAVEVELASTLRDVLVRRTQVFFRAADQGLSGLARVAERMAELLGWDAARRESEEHAYATEVALSRQWQQEPWPAAPAES
jgi:glycerol-3-phosphate dehydrogenase